MIQLLQNMFLTGHVFSQGKYVQPIKILNNKD